MPPRRARRNQNQPAAQQQNGPALNQQAQPVPQYDFPLFENARTMQVLHKSFADVEFEKVAKRAQRSVNSLVVNVWDLCLAKKTGLTQGIHSPVKTKILSFMGDEPPATVHANLSAARLRALSNRTQDEFVKCITNFLTKTCEYEAEAVGNKSCKVTFSEMRANFAEKMPPGPRCNMRPIDKKTWAGKNWWKWLAIFLPSVPKAIEAAGIRMVYPEPEEEGGAMTGAEEESVLTLSWHE